MTFEFCGGESSILGGAWVCIYQTAEDVGFQREHFEQAMDNVIRHPNINSTVLLRADIVAEREYDCRTGEAVRDGNCGAAADVAEGMLSVGLEDVAARSVHTELDLAVKLEFVRRLVPRNPYKDALINQTCLVLNTREPSETALVVYLPHFSEREDCPFYIPPVAAVGILLHGGRLSVHYIPFAGEGAALADEGQRAVRTARRLLQTAEKHSKGCMNGYTKRVEHDVVVDKVLFQERYIQLKKKYSQWLVDNWAESTDPRKHVFEDIAIAAFLIELWSKIYGQHAEDKFRFCDMGCGNGVLCYILLMEGYAGEGIDARRRKSWGMFPENVRSCLKEQLVIPSLLLRPHPEIRKMASHMEHNGGFFPVHVSSSQLMAPATIVYSAADLITSPQVNIAEFPPNTFLIGNHSDELTCWIPLLGQPFMVIPCCSHNFHGARVRYRPSRESATRLGNSTYAGLVDYVEYLAKAVGWETEKEMLRIPSTRNAAIIGYKNPALGQFPTQQVYDEVLKNGGAEGWIQSATALLKGTPKSH
ncbi:AGL241Wp [Eremothecium gossypii ATCC 10895]|uniref:tRNA (uracil-O(2)-)-methyltransferase n=1 Tax=Eremothecium gossypii (strain ATCC 10895 / CBS 109.51 / FGSC 9923 / NRRL Y-1056) TaxID=284811 RepID=TRM44_EREGS|nr:AGL241Wp [Eremothecium gossypii ATCC 10895]Q751E7.1 RecName: Full=tRNA (uracil-O(2)-)-methyltransferase [Eremothecium gossypii ATCC 10895]AAS54250.1 AGL241Wp [Eremothecium gossypii ATCC 10895]AEY98576.1 FAGL241Wp [Eremothecium gossypii FDAG1]